MKSQLNEPQRKAVESTSSVILCLAGAGTGKTSTLTSRIAHLNENRVGCSSMLALTFTRLAGKEMKERVIKLIGPEGEKLFCNTFHAFCVKVLKEYGYLLGYDKEFTIYDQEDREAIIENIIRDYKFNVKAKEVVENLESNLDMYDTGDLAAAIAEYKFILKRNNAIDLDMLLTETLEILTRFRDVQTYYNSQYEYLFVDEFQDSNDIQMKIIKALDPRNLFVVGDDFQSIYGWRQAKPEYIINFEKYYPGCEIIKLEDNYRSTEEIIAAANNLISHNKNQTQKILKAHKVGPNIEYIEAEDIMNECNLIASTILEDGKYSDYAILTRTNKQIEPFIQTFKTFDVPYQLVSNKEDPLKKHDIKMILNILEVVLNPKDDATLKKVINFPVKRINEIQMQEIEKFQIDETICLMDALESAELLGDIQEFMQQLNEIYTYVTEKCSEAVKVFDVAICILKLPIKYRQENRENKIKDLDETMAVIERWEAIQSNLGESTDISSFLKWMHMKDIQEKLMEQRDAVKIMTVHASKGLEFKKVFVVGMNENVFPSKRGDLEEERRLCYVSITRAKEELFLTRAKKTVGWSGKELETNESRFLDEMRGGSINV